MKISVNENGNMLQYAFVGDVANSIDFDGAIPDEFEEYWWAFRLIDGVLERASSEEQETILRDRFGVEQAPEGAIFIEEVIS